MGCAATSAFDDVGSGLDDLGSAVSSGVTSIYSAASGGVTSVYNAASGAVTTAIGAVDDDLAGDVASAQRAFDSATSGIITDLQSFLSAHDLAVSNFVGFGEYTASSLVAFGEATPGIVTQPGFVYAFTSAVLDQEGQKFGINDLGGIAFTTADEIKDNSVSAYAAFNGMISAASVDFSENSSFNQYQSAALGELNSAIGDIESIFEHGTNVSAEIKALADVPTQFKGFLNSYVGAVLDAAAESILPGSSQLVTSALTIISQAQASGTVAQLTVQSLLTPGLLSLVADGITQIATALQNGSLTGAVEGYVANGTISALQAGDSMVTSAVSKLQTALSPLIPDIGTSAVSLVANAQGTITTLKGTAAAFAQLTQSQIVGLAGLGVTRFESADAVILTPPQVLGLEVAGSVMAAPSVILNDTLSNVQTYSAAQIAALQSIGVTAVDTAGSTAGVTAGDLRMVLSGTSPTTVSSGGIEELVSGIATAADTVLSGGSQVVQTGAATYDVIVSGGGTVDVKSGAWLDGVTFSGPATVDVEAGATILSSAIVMTGISGAVLEIGSTVPAGASQLLATIDGFGPGDEIDLQGLAYSSGVPTVSRNDQGFSVTSGNASLEFPLSGADIGAIKVSDDGHGGTLLTGAAPIVLAGGSGGTTDADAALQPFAGASVQDPNPNATVTLDITLQGTGGKLSGPEVLYSRTYGQYTFYYELQAVEQSNDQYTLSGPAAAVTSALQELTFTPAEVQIGGSAATTFVLSASDDYNARAVDSSTVVREVTAGNFVSSGGRVEVGSGQTVSGFDAYSYGIIEVGSSGSALGTIVTDGLQIVDGGGTASGTVLLSGGEEYLSSGASATSTFASGGLQAVSGGATAVGTLLEGTYSAGFYRTGEQLVYAGGTASGTIVYDDGLQSVSPGGSAIGTIVSSGGELYLQAGAFTSDITVLSGGSLDLIGAPLDAGTSVASGATVYVESAYGGAPSIESGLGVFDGVTLSVCDGGTTSGTFVDRGGTETLSGDFGAVDTPVSGSIYPRQTLSAVVATASGTAVKGGGTEVVSGFGMAVGTVVSSGGTQILSGDLQEAYLQDPDDLASYTSTASATLATASGTVVKSGGTEIVSGLGLAIGTAIASGGTETVLSGGTTSNTTVAGGTLVLSAGSVVDGSITFSGGGAIDLAGLAYADGTTSAVVSGATLTVTDGGATETFSLGSPSLPGVTATSDGSGGTLVTVGLPVTVTGGSGTNTTSEAPVHPFSGVTVQDPNADATDTVEILLSGVGVVSGAGLSGSGGRYTLSAATVSALTDELQALTFTPAAPAPARDNSSDATGFLLVASDSFGIGGTDDNVFVVDTDPAAPPTIATAGTAQTVRSEASATPFSGATLTDPNAAGAPSYAYDAGDTLTITLEGGTGTLADGSAFTGTSTLAGGSGTYTLTGTAAQIQAELQDLAFTPAKGAANSATTTTFALSDVSTAGPTATVSGSFSTVTDIDGTPPPQVALGGTAQTVQSEASASPFANATLADPNASGGTAPAGSAQDTLTIMLEGGTGTLADGSAFAGISTLEQAGSNSYTLTGTAAQIQAELQDLAFTPAKGAANSTTTTTFVLSDASAAGGSAAVSGAQSTVTDLDSATVPKVVAAGTAQTVHGEGTASPFADATVADPNASGGTAPAGSAQDTLTITLEGGTGTLANGPAFKGTSTLKQAGANSYTLTGTGAQIQAELQDLAFTPAQGPANSTTTTTFVLSDTSAAGGSAAVSGAQSTVTDLDSATAPLVAGGGSIVAAQNETVTPFASATVADPNAASTETLTVVQTGTGGLSYEGAPLSGTVWGATTTYTLTGTAAAVTAELQELVFAPATNAANTTTTTSFVLSDVTTPGTSAASPATRVTDTVASVAPVVVTAGTAQTVWNEAVATPFANATVTDQNAAGAGDNLAGSAQDTLTIRFGGGTGTLADGSAFTGTGTLAGGSGTYTLTGTAAQIQAELQDLVFTPGRGASNSTTTTTFVLSDMSAAGGPATVKGTPSTVTDIDPRTGTVVDGYIAGATVFEDTNRNGVLDPGEVSTVTDAQGHFSLPPSAAPLVVVGGTDISTGIANTAVLTAPAGASVVTPLTTLVSAVAVQNGGDVAAAQAKVASALGLPSGSDLLTLDPVAATQAGTPGATAAYVASAQAQDTVSLLSAAGSTSGYAAIASAIATSSGMVDLSNAATLATIGSAAGLTDTTLASTIALAQSSNTSLASAAAAAATPAAVLTAVAATQKTAQGTVAPSLAAAVATGDSAALQQVVSAHATPDAVSLSPDVGYSHGVFTLSGAAASTTGVASVDISAVVDGGTRQDLGAATLGPNGTYTLQDRIGASVQGFFEATVTDGAGLRTVSADPLFSLQGGLGPDYGAASEALYTADGSQETAVRRYSSSGSENVRADAAGQTFTAAYDGSVENNGRTDTAFVFDPGFSLDVVNGFRIGGAGHDTLNFLGSDFGRTPQARLGHLLANSYDSGGSLFVIDPTTQDAVQLKGVTKAQLVHNERDILFR